MKELHGGLWVLPAKITFTAVKIDEPHSLGITTQLTDFRLPALENFLHSSLYHRTLGFLGGERQLTTHLFHILEGLLRNAADDGKKLASFNEREQALLIDFNNLTHKLAKLLLPPSGDKAGCKTLWAD